MYYEKVIKIYILILKADMMFMNKLKRKFQKKRDHKEQIFHFHIKKLIKPAIHVPNQICTKYYFMKTAYL